MTTPNNTSLLLLISALVLLWPPIHNDPAQAAAPTDAAAPSDPTRPDAFGTYGADPTEMAILSEARELFSAAGLSLPPLRIYFHDSQDGCLGNLGLYNNHGDTNRIDICLSDQRVIRHELAHAWEQHRSAGASRPTFLAQAGSVTWDDQSTPHPARGIEQAADLVSWGIDTPPIQLINASHHAEQLALYELLTGSRSPRTSSWTDDAYEHVLKGHRPSGSPA